MSEPITVPPRDTNWHEIRRAYAAEAADDHYWHDHDYRADYDQKLADADRWLAEHDREVRAETFREAAQVAEDLALTSGGDSQAAYLCGILDRRAREAETDA